MIKKLLLLTLLFSVFSVPALADTGQHLVLLKGNAKGFEKAVAELGGHITYHHKRVGFAIVAGLDTGDVSVLGTNRSVAEIREDRTFLSEPTPQVDGALEASTFVDNPAPADAYFYGLQWNMMAIDADMAWNDEHFGSSDVTVAILDTGIDYTHPDLAGLVDLSRSKSFVPFDDYVVDLLYPGANPIADLDIHGTHVAATVASNAFLAAGVTAKTTLVGVKICSAFGGCEFSAIVSGLLHAVDVGADVANMSLGGAFSKAGAQGFGGFINRLFNYANSQGMAIVVSAGNEAIDLDHDGNAYKTFCSTPNTICVSATGPTNFSFFGPWENIDAPADYTNYGRSAINVAAPGGNGSYVWAACSSFNLYSDLQGCQDGLSVVGMGGTSMAAPHVTGLAALMVEKYGRNPGRIKTAIQNSADDLGKKGTDPFYGKGRINVNNAVQ